MIVLATVYDFEGHGSMPTNWFSVSFALFPLPFHVLTPFSGFPSVFGAAIYSFMCHHRCERISLLDSYSLISLPSIVTPIKNKKRVLMVLLFDNVTVFITYIALCWTAVWAFGAAPNETCSLNPGPPCKLQSLYTQNFASYSARSRSVLSAPLVLSVSDFKPVAVFLVLFPIFTLSSNFPMITITLRNNLMQLITYKSTRGLLATV